MKEGVLVVDKPSGMTSHDVVDVVRKKLKVRRVGHSGTLDPLATGVLVLLIGRATKLFSEFVHFDKTYEATVRLGCVTSTGDLGGRIISCQSAEQIAEDDVHRVFHSLLGERPQIPPMVSALKVQGRRLYELARRGIEVQRQARLIKIHEIKVLRLRLPEVDFYVHCSKGTYVRRLGEEVGEALGCGGCVSQIRRISTGCFHIKDAIKVEDIHEGYIRAWDSFSKKF